MVDAARFVQPCAFLGSNNDGPGATSCCRVSLYPRTLYYDAAENVWYSKPAVRAHAAIHAYKAEFAAALGIAGTVIPYTAAAIAVWGLVGRLIDTRAVRNKLARRIAKLDTSIQLLKAQLSMMRVYWDPVRRAKMGLHPECATGCALPEPEALMFWEKTLRRLQTARFAKTLSPSYFNSKLTRAVELTTLEMAQLQNVFTLQKLIDEGLEGEMDREGVDALRMWREAVQLSKQKHQQKKEKQEKERSLQLEEEEGRRARQRLLRLQRFQMLE